jgi:hypothetical protein
MDAKNALSAATNLMVDPLRPERVSHGFAAMEQHLREDY